MAYYDALIAAWNSVTQPPTGVTGTALTSGMSTPQKIAAVNGWTVTGAIPSVIYVSGAQLLNCINWTEFAALTATQQANLLALCQVPGQLLGGSGNTAFIVDGMFLAYFSHSGATIIALTALATSMAQPWWQVAVASGGGGLNNPVTAADCAAAGLS